MDRHSKTAFQGGKKKIKPVVEAKKHFISGRIWFLLSQQMFLLKTYALQCSCSVWEGLWILFFFLFFHNYFVLDIANLHIRTVPFTITSTRLWGFKHFAMKNWGSLPKFHDMFLKISHEIYNMFVPEISLFSELSLFTTHSRSFPDFYMSLNSSGSSYF